jgi:predicted ester cyclase
MAFDAETAERVARAVLEVGFSTGDLSVIDEVVSPDFVEHQRGAAPGREGLKAMIRRLRTWFPDLRLTVVDMAVSGDKVGDKIWARVVARATNTEPVMGKPPTGKPIEIDIIDIMRVVDGKLVEHWGVPDTLAMMEQVGLVPAR